MNTFEQIFEIIIVVLSVFGLLMVGVYIGKNHGSFVAFINEFIEIKFGKHISHSGVVSLARSYPYTISDVSRLVEYIALVSTNMEFRSLSNSEKNIVLDKAKSAIIKAMENNYDLFESYDIITS